MANKSLGISAKSSSNEKVLSIDNTLFFSVLRLQNQKSRTYVTGRLFFKIPVNRETYNTIVSYPYDRVDVTLERILSPEERKTFQDPDDDALLRAIDSASSDFEKNRLIQRRSMMISQKMRNRKEHDIVDGSELLLKKTILLGSYVKDFYSQSYRVPFLTQQKISSRYQKTVNQNVLDVESILDSINSVKTKSASTSDFYFDDITSVVNPDLSSSMSDDDILQYYKSRKSGSDFNAAASRYFLKSITTKSKSENEIKYDLDYKKASYASDIQIDKTFDFDYFGVDNNIKLKLEVYRKKDLIDSQIPAEKFEKTINLSTYSNTYNKDSYTSIVDAVVTTSSDGSTNITPVLKNSLESSLVASYNVYVKDISSTGQVDSYTFIGNVDKDSTITVPERPNRLSIVRIVPVGYDNIESNVFKNIVTGRGYQSLRKVTVIPGRLSVENSNKVTLEVHDYTPGSYLSLYRRNCGLDASSTTLREDYAEYKIVSQKIPTSVTEKKTTLYDDYTPGKTYEYYVTAYTDNDPTAIKYSDPVIFRHVYNTPNDKSVDVVVDRPSINLLVKKDGTADLTFNTSLNITSTDVESLRKILEKDPRFKDFYDRYLNAANVSSTVDVNTNLYGELILVEVVRTNLTTGRRDTFPISEIGTFKDTVADNLSLGIPPINAQDNYVYQVFSYSKDPFTLFSNFVSVTSDDKGFEVISLPYKWRMFMLSGITSIVPVCDKDGYPQLSQYDTLKPLGLSDTYFLEGSSKLTEVQVVKAQRIDAESIYVSWNYTSPFTIERLESVYDSFMILKVLNGVRSVISRVKAASFLYNITDKDLGDIYFVVVPVMNNMSLDTAKSSNSIFIDVDAVVKSVKV